MPLPSNLKQHLDLVERALLIEALNHFRWNRTAAGLAMGLTLRQMRYRMARLKINDAGTTNVVVEMRQSGYNTATSGRTNPEWRD